MKKLILFLSIIPLFVMAQEDAWKPILPNQTTYFGRLNYNSTDTYNTLRAIKIDSIQNNSEEQILYNVKNPRFIGREGEDTFYHFYDPNSSWIGSKLLYVDDYLNIYDDVDRIFRIKYGADIGKSWLYNIDNEGNFVIATLDSIGYESIMEDVYDSVKYISFEAFDNNWLHLDHNINERILKISKYNGFVECFYINDGTYDYLDKWPSKLMTLIGIEKQGETMGFEWDFDEMIHNYEISDEIHLTYSYKNKGYGDPFQHVYADKQFSDDIISYKIDVCNEDNQSFYQIDRKYILGLMPYQSYFSNDDSLKGFYSIGMRRTPLFDHKAYSLRVYNNLIDSVYLGKETWMFSFEGSLSGYSVPYQNCTNFHTYISSTGESNSYELVYFQNAYESYGEPLEFTCNITGLNPIEDDKFIIAPNPSNGVFNINKANDIEDVKVFSFNGQLVWQVNKPNKETIDLSNLENGVYLIEITTQNQQINHQKLIINK